MWALADRLRRRGHDVTLFAGPGLGPAARRRAPRSAAPAAERARPRADVSMTAPEWVDEHHAYLQLMLRLGRDRRRTTSTSSTTTASTTCRSRWRARCRSRWSSTLHTPPTPVAGVGDPGRGRAARSRSPPSARTPRAAWSHVVPDARVIHNGVDVERWHAGAGRRTAGVVRAHRAREGPAPRHRRRDARAGMPLVLAGPIADRAYFEREIRPRLGARHRRTPVTSTQCGARRARGRARGGARDPVLG